VDTGLTLSYLVRTLQARQPLSLRVCTLLDRSVRRIVDLPMAFRGFDIPDRFVVATVGLPPALSEFALYWCAEARDPRAALAP
jgi:hypoxanthine-guanine phosphoribosyltransferase